MSGAKGWVNLNVGGKRFTTTRQTLCSDPRSMLARMFGEADDFAVDKEEEETQRLAKDKKPHGHLLPAELRPPRVPAAQQDDTGAYLIDHDPEFFRPVLNYLRTGMLVLGNADPAGVLESARFFQVLGVMAILDPSGTISERNQRRSIGAVGDASGSKEEYMDSSVIMLVLFSGIVYVTGINNEGDKTILHQPKWVAGVDVFSPGGTTKMPCYQLQSKSGSLNRGHLLELISHLIRGGWALSTSSHDRQNDVYTLTR